MEESCLAQESIHFDYLLEEPKLPVALYADLSD
jgi:hypothetical protein